MIRVLLAIFGILVDAWVLWPSTHTTTNIVTTILLFGAFRAFLLILIHWIGRQFDVMTPESGISCVVKSICWPITDLAELWMSIDHALPGKKLVRANNG